MENSLEFVVKQINPKSTNALTFGFFNNLVQNIVDLSSVNLLEMLLSH